MTDDTNQIAVAYAMGDLRKSPNSVQQAALEAALASLLIPLNFATPMSKHSETSYDYVGYGSRTWVSARSKVIVFFLWTVLVFIAKVFDTNSEECLRSRSNASRYDDDDDPYGACLGWEFFAVLEIMLTIIFGIYGIGLCILPVLLPITMFREFEKVWDFHDVLASGEEGLSLTDDGIIIGPSDKPNIQFLAKLVTERGARGQPVPQILAAALAWFQLIQTESVLSADGHPILSRESLAPFLPEVRKAEIAMMRKAEIARMRALKGPGEEGERERAANAAFDRAMQTRGCEFVFDHLIARAKNSASPHRADLLVVAAAHLWLRLFLVRGEASVDCCYMLLEKFMEARRVLIEDLFAESRRGRRLGTLFDSDATSGSRHGDADHMVVAIPPLSLNSDPGHDVIEMQALSQDDDDEHTPLLGG